MGESGTIPRSASGAAVLVSPRGGTGEPDQWPGEGAGVRGPLLTLVAAVAMDVIGRHHLPFANPFPVLMLTVVYAAYAGGLRPALVSTLMTVFYGAHFLAEPGTAFHYTSTNALGLIAVTLVTPAAAVLVARLKETARRAHDLEVTRQESMAMERRLSLLAEVDRILAASLDYETNLRELARLAVPALADWCVIHVERGGASQFVAGMHRDPARDLVVRALCEYDPRHPPFGVGPAPELGQVTDDLLSARAVGAEHLKLYRALAPDWYLTAPMKARERTAGVVTLGMGESGRRFDQSDLEFATELAGRAALAVDNALLARGAEEAEQRYRMLFEGNPQPMWVFDVDSLGFLAVNDAAIRHYGYSREEFLEMTIISLRPPEDAPGVLLGAERGGSPRGGTALAQHQRKDGGIVDMELISHELDVDGRPARLVLATDVTDRTRTRAALRRSEEELRQAQRMDAMARLAGAVAHDFNNLLTTIRGYSDLLYDAMSDDAPGRKDVERIRNAADRATLLARQLLSLGRHRTLQPRPLDLNALVTGMEGLVQRLVGADVRVDLRLSPALGRVNLDPGHLEQVLVSLVLNAREAMPAGGTLTIETGERQVGRSTRGRSVRPGRYVVLAVSDTGAGLDDETLTRLFDPSAGSVGRGHPGGLGLSIIAGIVRQSGGAVRVSSEPGAGTTMKVYLPRHDEPEGSSEPLPEGAATSGRGSETVLVVEDEEGVRELLRAVLTEHGYTVLAARHGRDALLESERHEGPIHLLATDVVMPEMGGRELVAQLLPRRPGLKVLFISGYSNDEVVRRGVDETAAAFVHKPFSPAELVQKVRQVLDESTAPAAAGS